MEPLCCLLGGSRPYGQTNATSATPPGAPQAARQAPGETTSPPGRDRLREKRTTLGLRRKQTSPRVGQTSRLWGPLPEETASWLGLQSGWQQAQGKR